MSPDSYGLVLALIVLTYVLAVGQGTSAVLAAVVVLVQVATVWFVLITARANRAARRVALGVLRFARRAGWRDLHLGRRVRAQGEDDG